jgi:hypothetical protein
MRTAITKESNRIPLTVDEGTVKSVNRDKPWGDYEFNCPCCEKELIINSTLLTNDEYNDCAWIGNCPHCKVEMILHRPD